MKILKPKSYAYALYLNLEPAYVEKQRAQLAGHSATEKAEVFIRWGKREKKMTFKELEKRIFSKS